MRIQLDSSDISQITKRVGEIIKANDVDKLFFTTKVERYGLSFKVSVTKETDEFYMIDEISFYGVNTNNVSVSFDYDDLNHFGRIYIN